MLISDPRFYSRALSIDKELPARKVLVDLVKMEKIIGTAGFRRNKIRVGKVQIV